MLPKKNEIIPCMVVLAYNPSTQEDGAGVETSLGYTVSSLTSETLLKKKKCWEIKDLSKYS
jgi:hypothetical protein